MSEVALTVPAPKEVVDYLKAVEDLVGKLVAKEPLGQLAIEEFMAAQQLYSEFAAAQGEVVTETDEVIDAAALFGRRIAYRALGKPVTPVKVV